MSLKRIATFPTLGLADAEGVDIVPAPQRLGAILETDRFTRPRDPAVDLEPVLFVRRRELAHPPPGGVHEPGLPLERLVHLDEPIVGRLVGVVEQDLDDAEALVDGVEQHPVPRLALAQRRLGVLAVRDVGAQPDMAEELAVPREKRIAVRLDPAPRSVEAPDAPLGSKRLPLPHRAGERLDVAAVVAMDERVPPASRHLLQGGSEELPERPVDEHDIPLRVRHPHDDRGAVRQDPETFLGLEQRVLHRGCPGTRVRLAPP
jgi:hypothetical protein